MPTATPLQSEPRNGSSDLPSEFAHPPLIEAWLGVEFDRAANLNEIDAKTWRDHLGLEWLGSYQLIGPAERHAPGHTHIEKQLRNVMNDRAIRFNSNGFSFGWLGYDGSIYPRYETIRDGFVATLDAVSAVVPEIGPPKRTVVSYLNRIPRGTTWNTFRDWTFFRLWLPNPLPKIGVDLEHFAGRWQFPLEGRNGYLAVEFTHEPSCETLNSPESLWLRISCCTETGTEETLFDGMDHGRETIVRAFDELVTADAKEFWGVAPRKRS